MRLLLAIPVALLVSACAPARLAPAAPSPEPSPTPCTAPPEDLDLTGSWMTGIGPDAAEPSVPEILLQTECAHHPAAWVLRQSGDEIEAWTFEASFDQGIATKESPARMIPDRGRVCGREVAIESRYRLRYDPESGHLRGTIDGKPFWAVRQRVVGPGPCPGIP